MIIISYKMTIISINNVFQVYLVASWGNADLVSMSSGLHT